MPATVKWENEEQTVLVFKLQGFWTVQDFHQLFQQSNTLMDSVTHKVNWIIDVRESRSLPNGFLSAIRNVSKRPHTNAGKVAMIGLNAYARAFIRTVRQVLRKDPEVQWMQIVDSYEEAHHIFNAAQK